MYILDMVRALEREMLKRIHAQGLNMEPQIIVITRLIPEALGVHNICPCVGAPGFARYAPVLCNGGDQRFASMERHYPRRIYSMRIKSSACLTLPQNSYA